MWATADDVLDRWIGDDPPTDDTLVGRWVADAEVVVASAFPGLDDRIVDDPTLLDRVRIVVARMVTRAFRNPEGFRQVNETAGPFSEGGTFSTRSIGDFMLTDEDRAILGGLPGPSRQRAFTIDTTPQTVTESTPWWVTP